MQDFQNELETQMKNYELKLYGVDRHSILYIGIMKKESKSEDKIIIIKLYKNIFVKSSDLLYIIKNLYYMVKFKSFKYSSKLSEIKFNSNKKNLSLIFKYNGIELNKIIKTKVTDIREQKGFIQWIFFQLILILYYFHSLGIIHRDIKPSNIIINDIGQIRINDFSLAINKMNKISDYSKEGSLFYLAPELLLKNAPYDEKVDMWAATIIFIELSLKTENFLTDKNNIGLYTGTQLPKEQLKYIIRSFYPKIDTPDENEFWNNDSKVLDFIYKIKDEKIDFTNLFKGLEGIESVLKDNDAMDLLQGLLTINPNKRFSAKEALCHNYFKEYINCVDLSLPNINLDTSFEKQYFMLKDENERINLLRNELINICKNYK